MKNTKDIRHRTRKINNSAKEVKTYKDSGVGDSLVNPHNKYYINDESIKGTDNGKLQH